jgi:hypothetical protein
MTQAQAKNLVKFIRSQTTEEELLDLRDTLVDEYEIGYSEADLLIMLAQTDFVV